MNYELIYNLLKDDKRNNKKTLDFYVKNILKIYNDFDNKDITKLHIQDFYDYFNLHKYSNHTQKNKLISLYVYFDKLGIDNKLMADIKTSIDSLKDKIDEKYETHEKNDKEKKELLTKQDFKDLIDSFKPKSKTIKYYNDYHDEIIYLIGLYHYYYPMRNELANTMIYTKPEYNKIIPSMNVNYLIIDKINKKLIYIMNSYKTQKTYGSVQYDILEKDLYDLVNKIYGFLKSIHSNILLVKIDGTPLNRNDLTKLFKVNYGFSTSMIRKIFLTDKYNIKDMEKQALIMGHSINQELKSYVKNK